MFHHNFCCLTGLWRCSFLLSSSQIVSLFWFPSSNSYGRIFRWIDTSLVSETALRIWDQTRLPRFLWFCLPLPSFLFSATKFSASSFSSGFVPLLIQYNEKEARHPFPRCKKFFVFTYQSFFFACYSAFGSPKTVESERNGFSDFN